MVQLMFLKCCRNGERLLREGGRRYVLIYEPLMRICYVVGRKKYEIFSDTCIPDILKSRMARFLLTRRVDKYETLMTPVTNAKVVEPIQKSPRDVLNDLQTLLMNIESSKTYEEFMSYLNDNDKIVVEKICLQHKYRALRYPYVIVDKHEKIMKRVRKVYLSIMKDLLSNYLGLKTNRLIYIDSWKIMFYPLIYDREEGVILRCLKKVEVDTIYTRFFNLFRDELSTHYKLDFI